MVHLSTKRQALHEAEALARARLLVVVVQAPAVAPGGSGLAVFAGKREPGLVLS